jgi:hypothetical protein
LCAIGIVLNLVLPFVEKNKFTFFFLTQFLAIGVIYVYALVNVVGNQNVPIVATFFVRIVQALIFIGWSHDISWTSMGVLVFVDILLILLLVLDKGNYEYVFVQASKDEFLDV